MRREFIAITLAYLVGIGSFIAQWQAEYTQPLKNKRNGKVYWPIQGNK
jgi:hypothetical protein